MPVTGFFFIAILISFLYFHAKNASLTGWHR